MMKMMMMMMNTFLPSRVSGETPISRIWGQNNTDWLHINKNLHLPNHDVITCFS